MVGTWFVGITDKTLSYQMSYRNAVRPSGLLARDRVVVSMRCGCRHACCWWACCGWARDAGIRESGVGWLPRTGLQVLSGDIRVQRDALAPDLAGTAFDRLRADALRSEAPAGRILYYAGDRPAPGLVVSGLVRMFVTSGEGRQITVAYMRAGGLFGMVEQITGEPAPVSVQALTDARLLRFRASAFDEALRAEPSLSWRWRSPAMPRLPSTVWWASSGAPRSPRSASGSPATCWTSPPSTSKAPC